MEPSELDPSPAVVVPEEETAPTTEEGLDVNLEWLI